MTSAASVQGDERLRLFLALRLPDDVVAALAAWQAGELGKGRRGSAGRIVPPAHLHVTLAFLGSRPASELPAIVAALRESAAAARPFDLAPERYRETRSVGMLVLTDESGEAGRLAVRRTGSARSLRRWRSSSAFARTRSTPGGRRGRSSTRCTSEAGPRALCRPLGSPG